MRAEKFFIFSQVLKNTKNKKSNTKNEQQNLEFDRLIREM